MSLTVGKTGIIPIFLIILLLFTACATGKGVKTSTKTNLYIETRDNTEKIPEKQEPNEEEKLEKRINDVIFSMTLDEKIGQMFMLSVRSDDKGERVLHPGEFLQYIIDRYKPGGIIFFSTNFANPVQTRDLIRGAQSMSTTPLFTAVDEEGGVVARLGNSERMSVTSLPPAAVIGQTGKTEHAQTASRVISRELKALGFNMNMAPVADVNTNRSNPVIGNRTYSSNPLTSGKMVAAVTETMDEENMISVLKHFPGHGDTNSDSHKGDVILEHDLERLELVEFVPFRMGIEAGADAVMIAHIKVPSVTGSEMPATMSPVLLKDILREDLGFEGVIITDAMDMGAIKNYWSADKAAVNAILAGVDIILMPAGVDEAYRGIKDAIAAGLITTDRIEESLRRILRLKIKRGIFDTAVPGSDKLLEILGSEEHRQAIAEITG